MSVKPEAPFLWMTTSLGQSLRGGLVAKDTTKEVDPRAALECRCAGASPTREGHDRLMSILPRPARTPLGGA